MINKQGFVETKYLKCWIENFFTNKKIFLRIKKCIFPYVQNGVFPYVQDWGKMSFHMSKNNKKWYKLKNCESQVHRSMARKPKGREKSCVAAPLRVVLI